MGRLRVLLTAARTQQSYVLRSQAPFMVVDRFEGATLLNNVL